MDDALKSMDMGGIHGSSMGIHMNTTISSNSGDGSVLAGNASNAAEAANGQAKKVFQFLVLSSGNRRGSGMTRQI